MNIWRCNDRDNYYMALDPPGTISQTLWIISSSIKISSLLYKIYIVQTTFISGIFTTSFYCNLMIHFSTSFFRGYIFYICLGWRTQIQDLLIYSTESHMNVIGLFIIVFAQTYFLSTHFLDSFAMVFQLGSHQHNRSTFFAGLEYSN